MRVYTTVHDYINANIALGLGDVELTYEQAQEVARRMTDFHETYEVTQEDGSTATLRNVYTEREDLDFWDVVADVLGDN